MELTIGYYGRRLNDDESVTLSSSKSSMHRVEEKECPYSESDTPKIFGKLFEKGRIELPESRHPKKIRRIMTLNTVNIIGSSVFL